MFRNFPLTKIRIVIAKIIYRFVRIFYNDTQQITRGNILYHLDLKEGIDFSIFLLGDFQKYISDSPLIQLSGKYTVIDVGANIGQMTLRFARKENCQQVFAFEPTGFAFAKLQKNLALNPVLSKKIVPIKSFVSNKTEKESQLTAYASWKLAGNKNENIHPLHLGSLTDASHTPSITIDDFVAQQQIENLKLIKIDTDGNEPAVMYGALETIKKYKPYIIFEAGLYIIEENGGNFAQYFELFSPFSYKLIDLKSGKQISQENYKQIIPQNSTTDVLAIFE